MSDGAKIQEQKPITAVNSGNEIAVRSVIPTAKKRANRTVQMPCFSCEESLPRWGSWLFLEGVWRGVPGGVLLLAGVCESPRGFEGKTSSIASQIGKRPSGNLVYDDQIIILESRQVGGIKRQLAKFEKLYEHNDR